MTLIVLFIFLELFSTIEGGCPIRCDCGANSITCVSKNLECVPYFESITNNPVIIDLSGNSIAMIDIDDFSFDKSDQVKEIFLNGSELITIEEKAFDELENLQELYLGDNYLNSVPEKFIIKNENMILLDISRNYFNEMPKIKSNSLEVLAAASCSISKIPNDALEGLPNLRVLLLQQNNLKSVDPTVFNAMGNLFFVRMAYNPWQCNCKTVKLFNYLTIKRFADIAEPIQCQTHDKTFIDIYNDKGLTQDLKNQCTNFDINYSDSDEFFQKEEFLQSFKSSEDYEVSNLVKNTSALKNNEPKIEKIDYYYITDFQLFLLLCFTVVFSLIVGTIFGSCVTYKYINRTIRQTESTKQLLTKSDANFVCTF